MEFTDRLYERDDEKEDGVHDGSLQQHLLVGSQLLGRVSDNDPAEECVQWEAPAEAHECVDPDGMLPGLDKG
jgi:hypothetical protein